MVHVHRMRHLITDVPMREKQTEEIVQQLSAQVQQLLKESARSTGRPVSTKDSSPEQKRTAGPVCWGCGKQEDCPQRRPTFAPICQPARRLPTSKERKCVR